MKLGYIILYVPDVAASIAFYEKAFGWNCRFQNSEGGNDYAELDTGATVLAFASEQLADSHGTGYRKARPDEPAPAVEIAMVTDDVDASFQQAVAAGAKPVKEPAAQSWGQTVSYVRDPNGFLIEICTPVG